MKTRHPLSGWKLALYSMVLGPVFLYIHLWSHRRRYPLIRILAFLPLVLLLFCAALSLSLAANPIWTRVFYGVLMALMIAGLITFNWTTRAVAQSGQPAPRPKIRFSRGLAWMFFMGIVFFGLSKGVQAVNYWLFGEYVMVYFSSAANTFTLWLPVGAVFGFFYGIDARNDYFDRDLGAFNRSLAMALYLIIIASLMILALIVYPLQRLTPIAYTPQLADLLFYTFTVLAVLLAALVFIPDGVAHSLSKSMAAVTLAMPLIMLHTMVISGYTTTLNLTAASILESGGSIDAAKRWYAKAAPYIDHDPLLAALHHRQGVLNVLDGNYDAAITAFKKVISDYSEDFDVYAKARRYVESYRKNQTLTGSGRKILSVKHRTFEQAASCFPNSLAVILSFYEKQATPTRALSHAIKEGFDEGTFIWKADAFLNRRGYQLITTFWQTRQTLIHLLDAGYPVLIYIPGHVYTLYGYDATMDIFFCYNTAKLNRWDDAPFFDFQQEWMRSGFLMSVVVKNGDVEKVRAVAPALFDHRATYQDYQKTVLNRYYASRRNYWPDGNRQHEAEAVGLDALVFNDDIFHENGFSSLPWHPEAWDQKVTPILNQPWSTSWGITERQVVFLLFHHQPERARQSLQHYQQHIEDENFRSHERLVRLRLATALQAGDPADVRSIADNLVGIVNNHDGGSHWGYYFKAVGLMDAGEPGRAAQLLLPLLNKSSLEFTGSDADFWHVVRLLTDIQARDPALIPADKAKVLDLYRIRLAMDP